MAALKNTRHERFAQLLAAGKCVADAYEQAGFRRDDGNSSRLSKTASVTGRVQELTSEALERERKVQALATERCAVTRQSLIEKAQEICTKAMEAGQWSAATAAVKEIGVLSGIRIERLERGQPGEFDWIEKLSVEELRLLAAGKLDIESYRKDEDGSGRSRVH